MLRKATLVFLLITLSGGVLFPLVGLAGSYDLRFCPWRDRGGESGSFDDGDFFIDCPAGADKKKASYDGFVPCGKCVDVEGGIDWSLLSTRTKEASKQYCGVVGIMGSSVSRVYIDCQLCHIFAMLNNIVNFVLTKIVPPLAVLIIVIGGVMFYLGGASPGLITRGRNLIRGVLIGLALIYGAYIIVGTLLKVVGVADTNAVKNFYKNGVFSIECPIKMPAGTPSGP